jgi:hypothetical protein
MNNNKVLLILERAQGNLQVNKDSGDYVLEGIFAQFGVENNNKRIYEEKEYLPHLEYLKKQIAENRLMGELDHPEKFEVSLQKVSHVVESLDYDSKKRQIVGRVRLLDTPAGQIAKNLVDSGIPVSISSRAAGSVNENKKVEIKRIFTYDLVAHPGFENAQLNRVNESFGLESDDNIQIYDASVWSTSMFENTDSVNLEKNNKKDILNMNNANYVTEDAMQKYSVLLKEEFAKITAAIDEVRNLTSSNEKIERLEEKFEQLKNYANHLSEEISDNRGYADYLREQVNHGINYTETEVATRVDQILEYMNVEITPHVQKLIQHNNHIVNELNTHIEYTEENAGIMEKLIEHNDYLASEIEKNRAYAEFIAENAVEKNDFNNLIEYAEFMFENYSGGKKTAKGNISEENEEKQPAAKTVVKENAIPTAEKVRGRVTSIGNKIDAVLEQIKKEKIESLSEDKRYPFLKLLGENKRAEFAKLDETKKEKVSKTLLESKSLNSDKLEQLFESALVKSTTNAEPKWLSEAPVKFKKIYEGLSADAKSNIVKAAAWYNGKLESQYQIKNFWETRGLEAPIVESLNENAIPEVATATRLGYTNDVVERVAKSLQRRK